MIIKEIFGENRIIALAGDKSTGKTNNLMALLKDFRKTNKTTPIYVYGLSEHIIKWLKQFDKVYEISDLEQLADKKNSFLILDEFQRLRLNDRRYKDTLNKLIDFIYHNNNWLIFSGANLREFNSIIGSKIEGWCIKSINIRNLVNGSQLKEKVINYNGRYKSLNTIKINKSLMIVLNDDCEKIIKLDYIKEIDSKIRLKTIFDI